MSARTGKVIIAGAGQAGGWVAATIRDIQPEREILLVGAEEHPPYERPPLSKEVLLGKASAESAYLKPLDFYATQRIDLRCETRVTAIDPASQTVELSDGERHEYDALVIATGLRPRQLTVPGADHPRVRTLRNIADVAQIKAQFGPGRHLVAIGAGFIGLEVAAAAIGSGSKVTVLEAAPHALGRVVAPEVSAAIVGRHERRGVAFQFNARVERIADDNGKPRVELATGESLVADMVLVGIGAIPNDQLARDAGIACDDGILVDEHGRTADPAIYAAGDVCRQFSVALQRMVRLESWQNAQNQPTAVGRLIAGAPEPYTDLPWFWTDQYDDNFQIIGAPERWDQIVWRGAPDDDRFTAIYLEEGRVVAGNTLNNARDIRPLKQMILDKTVIDPALFKDMSTSLIKLRKHQVAQ